MNKPCVIFITVAALTGAVFNTGCDKQAMAAGVSATPATPVLGLNKEAADKAREHFETMWVNRGEFWYGISGTGGPESMLPRSLIEAKGVSFHISSGPLSEADKLNQLEWSGEVNVTAAASRRKPLQPGAAWKDWETGLELYSGDGATTYVLEKKAGQWRIVRPGCEVERPAPEDLIMPGSKEEKEYLLQQAEKKRLVDQSAAEAKQKIAEEAPRLIIGTWRDENSLITYRSDGTASSQEGRAIFGLKWSIDGDTLKLVTVEQNGKPFTRDVSHQYQILHIDTDSHTLKDLQSGQKWVAHRVK
jgi:hypothetical protein